MTAASQVPGGLDGRGPDPAQRSLGDLMGDVTRDLSTFVRQEVELAKAEARREATTLARAGGMFGGAGFAGCMVLLFLSFALWWGLSGAMGQGWAALIVAGVWAAVAAVLLSMARGRMRRIRGLPRTAQTVRQIRDALSVE
jgi:hypothetical protein